ncbi:Retrovirus-related Pol polyprotein from transposon 17.6, partial [Vitis vinifera]
CKKELQVLLVHEDEEEDDNQFDGRATEEPALIELKDAVELSLNSVVGLTTSGTMKIKGTIGSKEVIILVDSGATHNFLSLELVQQLALPLTTTTSYGVMMGTGISVKGKGICRGVCILMQGLTVVEDFLPLELGNTDVILGMPWLGTLGDVKVNWKMLTMKIKMGKAVIVLKGDPSLSRTEVSLKAMARALQHHSQGVWVELCQTSTTSELSEGVQEVPKTVKEVLAQHQQIFRPITGLPPSRDIDHAIQLIPGASPVNVQPYRYPHILKNEIERLVQEMLEARIVRPSLSPFSSPVLLVKKKMEDEEGYGAISWPLTQQLKKDAFNWNLEAEAAFQKLKTAMTTIPVLALPNCSQLFIVETDASGYGLGVVLMQSHRPVAYFSQVLSARERQKSIYERELMAIVLAVQKWRHYLLDRHFIVRTDQSSLKFLLEQRIVNESYQKWAAKLFGYDFEIQFQPGLEDKAVDALSRIPISMELAALMVPSRIDTSLISSQVEADPHLAKIQQRLLVDPDAYPRYSLDHGILLYKGRLVLPKASPLVLTLLQEGHASVVGGHSGFLRTYKRLTGDFFWVSMKNDIKEFVEKCLVC